MRQMHETLPTLLLSIDSPSAPKDSLIPPLKCKKCRDGLVLKGTASWAAENSYVSGHDFSRAVNAAIGMGALAPEGELYPN